MTETLKVLTATWPFWLAAILAGLVALVLAAILRRRRAIDA